MNGNRLSTRRQPYRTKTQTQTRWRKPKPKAQIQSSSHLPHLISTPSIFTPSRYKTIRTSPSTRRGTTLTLTLTLQVQDHPDKPVDQARYNVSAEARTLKKMFIRLR